MGWRRRPLVVQILRCRRNNAWPWPQPPLLVVAAVRTVRLKSVRKSRSSRVRQTKYNEKQLRRTKPVATCAVSLARMKQDSTHCWVNCASAQIGALRHKDWCRLMLTGLRGILLYSGIDAKLDEDHLEILNASGSDEVGGVTCALCHVLTSRPVEWARQ